MLEPGRLPFPGLARLSVVPSLLLGPYLSWEEAGLPWPGDRPRP